MNKYQFPTGGIHRFVSHAIKSMPDLTGKVVLDIPCGDGRASYEFIKKGATVLAYDLFPDFMKVEKIKAQYADLSHPLPLENHSVDYILCQEGIEHMPNQVQVFKEFNRVLKKTGVLLITTPNYSHLGARLSNFFFESDHWRRSPPTEMDSIWFAKDKSKDLYFGHLFLLGVQRLKTISTITGFKVKRHIKTKIGLTSVIFGILLYPLFVLLTVFSFFFHAQKNTHIDRKKRIVILWQRVVLNLSYKALLCKHIFWELEKEVEVDDLCSSLKSLSRQVS